MKGLRRELAGVLWDIIGGRVTPPQNDPVRVGGLPPIVGALEFAQLEAALDYARGWATDHQRTLYVHYVADAHLCGYSPLHIPAEPYYVVTIHPQHHGCRLVTRVGAPLR